MYKIEKKKKNKNEMEPHSPTQETSEIFLRNKRVMELPAYYNQIFIFYKR